MMTPRHVHVSNMWGTAREQVCKQTVYDSVGALVVGLICNLLVKPGNAKWFVTDAELAFEKMVVCEVGSGRADSSRVSPARFAFVWTAVCTPLAWGIDRALQSVAKFFA